MQGGGGVSMVYVKSVNENLNLNLFINLRTSSKFLYSSNLKTVFVSYGHNRNVVLHYVYVWHDNYTTNKNIVQANHIRDVHVVGMYISFYRHVHIFGNCMRICSNRQHLEKKKK